MIHAPLLRICPGELVSLLKKDFWFAVPRGLVKVKVLVIQSGLTLCDHKDCSLPGYSVHGDSTGKNTGGGCHSLLQGIFLIQGWNPGLLNCRQILYHLSHQGSPITIKPRPILIKIITLNPHSISKFFPTFPKGLNSQFWLTN